ncbi:HAD family phosphatase [bacterium]|nr:HAD family phosphatase [bacterium]
MFFWGKKIKLILFDVGGVIVDADLDRYIQIGCALFQTTPDDLKTEVMARLPALETGSLDSARFWKEIGESLWRQGKGTVGFDSNYSGIWSDMLRATLDIDGQLLGIAKYLRSNGYKVGILSNVIMEHMAVLEKMGFYDDFDPCILSCVVGLRKPDKEIYKLAAETGKVSVEECLFIDDSPVNIRAAQEVGMKTLLFQSIEQLYQELKKLRLI